MSASPSPVEPPWPSVSVVMPVRDEEQDLRAAVDGVLSQEYPGDLELVMAVGPSRDRTEDLAREIAAEHSQVLVVPNPTGRTPAALNAALSAASGDVVVRVDGHSALSDGYVRRAVEVLVETGADNVGGMMVPQGRTPFEMAVARAMSSRIGIGGARFHVGGEAGPADTVYLGVFRRDALDRLGGFDETFVRAQDWELNLRIRASGGTVWFTPDLRVVYRPRSSVRALAAQFFRTGQWRRQVMRRYPGTASLRYLAPPVTVVVVSAGTLAAAAAAVAGQPWWWVGALAPAGYTVGVLAGSAWESRALPWRARWWLPVVLPVMHGFWGVGFLMGTRR